MLLHKCNECETFDLPQYTYSRPILRRPQTTERAIQQEEATRDDLQRQSDERLVQDLQMVFDTFDTDHSGAVDQSELRAMMIQLGVRVDMGEFHVLLKEVRGKVSGDLRNDGALAWLLWCFVLHGVAFCCNVFYLL